MSANTLPSPKKNAEGDDISYRNSGNNSSDEQKEIARLKCELRDAQEALDVLKNHQHSEKKLTTAIYIKVSVKL